MKFYGSEICPDCVYAKTILDRVNLQYEYVDITESVTNLREFLALRDKRQEFEIIKAHGLIGIPCFLMDDGKIEFEVFDL